jgi:hypothetical protein
MSNYRRAGINRRLIGAKLGARSLAIYMLFAYRDIYGGKKVKYKIKSHTKKMYKREEFIESENACIAPHECSERDRE